MKITYTSHHDLLNQFGASSKARYAVGLTNDPIHPGSWFGLPDIGLTEWLQGQKPTVVSPVNEEEQKKINSQQAAVMGAAQSKPSGTPTSNPNPSGGNTGGSAGAGDSKYQQYLKMEREGQLNPAQKSELDKMKEEIGKASQSQEDAARAAAEARRQAAKRAYEGKVAAAGQAKESAKGQYDWITETLGTNKKDLLDQVALNETTGTQAYEKQQADTKVNYDKSRQEILSTYRDLQKEQEKILRGTGVASSSRAQEASLRLNNLMGKDLGEVSTGEADSLAMIGNALSAFKSGIVLTKNSIENETKSKLDKAALDYDTQIKAIDQNTQLAANEREDAYAAAEAALAQDTANIKSWAAGLTLQATEAIAKTKGALDDFVVDMTDSNGKLNATLEDKQVATNELIQQISTSITLDREGNLTTPGQGTKRTPSSKSLADLYTPEGVTPVGVTTPGAGGAMADLGTNITQKAKNDPLLSAIFA